MSQSFGSRYQFAVLNLLGSLPHSAKMDESSISTAEKQFGIKLPAALRDYYLTLGNLHQFNDAHNHLLAPKDWFLNDDKLIFMVENQSVVYWGIETPLSSEDDPRILQGVNHLPKSVEWHPEHDLCSEFLLMMIHWSAVTGGLEFSGTSQMKPELAKQFVANWNPVGAYSDIVAYQREGCAACFLTGKKEWQLYVGTRSEGLLQEIEQQLSAMGVEMDSL